MKFITLFILTAAWVNLCWAGGKEVGNGGDANEPKFKEIALNIEQWIRSGNADSIKLPRTISLAQYKNKMLSALTNYRIHFTRNRVLVDGAEKDCANFKDARRANEILCNGQRFARIYHESIDDIYRLIHHEFAGLAGLENNDGSDSDYTISNQISGYLQFQVVKRLPITQKISSVVRIGDPARVDGDGGFLITTQEAATQYCASIGSRLPTAREFAEYAQSLGAVGVRETKYPEMDSESGEVRAEIIQNGSERYYAIYKKNKDGAFAVDFYYNPIGYEYPLDPPRQVRFWTSSTNPRDPIWADIFEGYTGLITDAPKASKDFFVACVVK